MFLKAVLFLLILASCCALLLLEAPTWRAAGLLALIVWTSARLYYFLFYVIERYIDPSYRFSGLASALRHIAGRRGRSEDESAGPGDA